MDNGNKHIIAVPIVGSGDMVITNTAASASAPIDLAGSLAGFTGNLYVVNGAATPTATNAAQLQLDTPLGNATKTIFLDQNTTLADNNQVVGAGTIGDTLTGQNGGATNSTPYFYTIANPVVLNFKGLTGSSANIFGVSRGNTINSVIYSKVVSFAGNISSLGSGATGVTIGGPNGVTVFSGNNSYTGNTTVTVNGGAAANTGMFQIASDHAIPATSALILGAGGGTVGPTDLGGHNITIAGAFYWHHSPHRRRRRQYLQPRRQRQHAQFLPEHRTQRRVHHDPAGEYRVDDILRRYRIHRPYARQRRRIQQCPLRRDHHGDEQHLADPQRTDERRDQYPDAVSGEHHPRRLQWCRR